MRVTKAASVLSAVLALTVILSGAAAAQTLKIGFVRDDRIYAEYTEWQRAQETWETDRKAWDDEASAKEQELQELTADYEKQRLILSDEKKREREAAIRAKREGLDAYTKQIYGPGGTAEQREAQLIEPLLTKIRQAMEAVATENSYDVIFTLQGIGYIKEEYDVTDKVLAALNEME
ncbi:MAG TPA: OmpH family outer membrane protein [candidate division Zixibacteria bacterium]|nr:OmpH family outer membrane protein [candidate division Zixibacteria bacterium]MDD4916994.1 OmpH family outer membrane protein [candidate division Zixibacteria bacterium]MDM7972615.1 OmpH family outer membrane protein [candidate division Zixibacteria bacterium]HOD66173.1 OmpH family outer membrane protein [candidate division Zixibacteria bacterium]HOZ09077.1 OmpH family outer membrane protein [candidate division Zixibacteria bacterium]